MFLIGEPSAAMVSLLIDEQRGAPLSYAEVGASRDAPGKVSGYAVDHNRVRLGDGEEAFVRASAALYAWKMFDLGWARLLPRGAPAGVGTTVAVLARHIGFRSLNFSRVVYEVSGEEGGVRKLGFAYGTLPENAESGQERFVVEWHPDKVRNDPGEDAMRGRPGAGSRRYGDRGVSGRRGGAGGELQGDRWA